MNDRRGAYRFAAEVRIFRERGAYLLAAEVRIFRPPRCVSFCRRGPNAERQLETSGSKPLYPRPLSMARATLSSSYAIVGVVDGESLGIILGALLTLGKKLGGTLMPMSGTDFIVGVVVGNIEGLSDGSSDGLLVGSFDGVLDGLLDGLLLGVKDGFVEGL